MPTAGGGAGGQLLFLPPLRPAAAFCARFPPLPEPELFLLRLEPLLFPPRLEEPGELEIAAARDLLIPFLRSPSYCLSFLTLGPWSLAITHLSWSIESQSDYPMRTPSIRRLAPLHPRVEPRINPRFNPDADDG